MKTLRLPPLCIQVRGAREVVSGQCLMLMALEMLLTFILCLAVVVVVVAVVVAEGVVVVELLLLLPRWRATCKIFRSMSVLKLRLPLPAPDVSMMLRMQLTEVTTMLATTLLSKIGLTMTMNRAMLRWRQGRLHSTTAHGRKFQHGVYPIITRPFPIAPLMLPSPAFPLTLAMKFPCFFATFPQVP